MSPYSSSKSTNIKSKPQTQPQTQTQWSAAFSPSLLLPHPDPRKFTRDRSTLTRAWSATTVDSTFTSASTATTSKSSFASQSSVVSAASFVAAVGASVKNAAAFGISARDADVDPGSGKKQRGKNKKTKGKGKGRANADAANTHAEFGVANSPPRLKPLGSEIGSGKLDLDADAFAYPVLLHPSSVSPSLYHNDNNYGRRDGNGNDGPDNNYYSNDDDDDEEIQNDKDNSHILINDTDHDPPPGLDSSLRLALPANSHTHRYTDSSSTITPSTYTRKDHHHHHHHKDNHRQHHHNHHTSPKQYQQEEASSSSIRKLKKRPPLPAPLVLPTSSSSSSASSFPRPRDPGLGPYASGNRTPVLQTSRSQPSLRLGTPSPISARSEESSETETGSFVIVTPPTPITTSPITTSTSNVSENEMKNMHASSGAGAKDGNAKRTASLLMRTFSLRSVSSVSGGLVRKRVQELEREVAPPVPPLPPLLGTPTLENTPTTTVSCSSTTPSENTTNCIAPASALSGTTSTNTSHDTLMQLLSGPGGEGGGEGECEQHADNVHSRVPAHASRLSGVTGGGGCGPMITIDAPVRVNGASAGTAAVAAVISAGVHAGAGGGVIYRDDNENAILNANGMVCRNPTAPANVNANPTANANVDMDANVNSKEVENTEKHTSKVGLGLGLGIGGGPLSSGSSSSSSSSSSDSSSSSSTSSSASSSLSGSAESSSLPSTSTTVMSASAPGSSSASGVPQRPASSSSSSSTPNTKAPSSTGEFGILPSTSLSSSSSLSFSKWRKWTSGLGERRLSPSASALASGDRDVKGKGKGKEKEKQKIAIKGKEGALVDSGSGQLPTTAADVDLAETHSGKHQHDGDDEEEGQNKQKKKRKSSLSTVVSSPASSSSSSSSKKHGHARSMSDSTFRLRASPGKEKGEENTSPSPLSSSSLINANAMAGKAKPKFILGCESDVDLPLASGSGSGSGVEVGPSSTGQGQGRGGGRPPLLRRNAGVVGVASSSTPADGKHEHIQPAPGLRRWTLASAITDEGISDEGLVRELERMREVGEWELSRRKRRRKRRRGGGGTDGEGQKGDGEEVDEDGNESGGEDRDQEGEEEEEENVNNCIVWDMGREIWDGPTGPHSDPSHTSTNSATSECPAASSSSSNTISASNTINTTTPASWLAAQRALLTCRELILTERHYLTHLETLLASQTQTAPPPLMLRYAAELICASRGVLALMEREPSVRGIASAFLEREEEVCAAYVRWCGVVGAWFVDLQSGQGQGGGQEVRKKKSWVRMGVPSGSVVATTSGTGYPYAGSPSECHTGDGDTDDGHFSTSSSSADGHSTLPTTMLIGVLNHGTPSHPPLSPLKRTVSTWRRSMPSITSLGLDGGVMSIYARREREKEKERDREREDGVGSSHSASPLSNSTVLGPGRNGVGTEGGPAKGPVVEHGFGKKSSTKPLAVRELAILPTQRVMRYVLLYRDLLTHTPHSSASRVLVERAVEAACRIAEKCNRAQDNAAFIQSSSLPNYIGSNGKENGGASASSSRSSSRRQVKDIAAVDDDVTTSTPSSAGLSGANTNTTPSSLPATASTSTSASSSTSSTSSSSQILTPPSSICESPVGESSPITDTTPRANKTKPRRLDRPGTADSSLRRTSLMAMSVAGFGAITGGWGRSGHVPVLPHHQIQAQAQTSQR